MLSCVELHPTSKGEYRPALHNQGREEERKAQQRSYSWNIQRLIISPPPQVAELLTSQHKRENNETSSLVMESGRDDGHVFILFVSLDLKV